MSIFYTGQGDTGESNLGGDKKVDKSCIEIETLNVLDELNSLIGLVKTQALPDFIKEMLDSIQEDLFIIQAHIGSLMFETKSSSPNFLPDKVNKLEEWSDYFEKKVQPARGFVIPGATGPSAWLHWLRAVSRRTELSIVHLNKTTNGKLSPAILAYHNRLSSVFYAMARYLVKEAGKEEKNPLYK